MTPYWSRPEEESLFVPQKNKGGCPRGSKDSKKRTVGPSARKGKSKYDLLNPPPGIARSDWDSWQERKKQQVLKSYEINRTGAGKLARRSCDRCHANYRDNCSFWANHARGRVCGNCERDGRKCRGGERAEDEPGADHLAMQPSLRRSRLVIWLPYKPNDARSNMVNVTKPALTILKPYVSPAD